MQGEWELKKLIVDIGKRIWTRGYVAANDGNISVKLNDEQILTTPTGVSKGFMSTGMIIKVDKNGKVISGSSNYKPSSEVKMHLEVYKERPDVGSVVHAHPPFCTSFAAAGIPLDKCVLPEAVLTIGAVPTASYGLPSTMEIPESIKPHLKTSDAILLENHGALTVGTDLINAYYKMETLEHTANIVWKAMQLGNLNVLSEKERDRLLALRGNYNLQGKVNICNVSPPNLNNKQKSFEKENINDSLSDELIDKITERVIEKLKKL